MTKIKFIIYLLLTYNVDVFSNELGYKARIQIQIFEGINIMIHERNLSIINECTIGYMQNPKLVIGACEATLTNLYRNKTSGIVSITMNGPLSEKANFKMMALANGIYGRRSRWPFFYN